MTASIWAPGSSISANSSVKSQSFTATASQTVFTLTNFSYEVATGSLLVFVSGAAQRPAVDFTETSATSFTLDTAVAEDTVVLAIGFVEISGTTIAAAVSELTVNGPTVLNGTVTLASPLPIAQGGTGQITAAAALAALGGVGAAIANTWSAIQTFGDGFLKLTGLTSGTTVLKAAAIAGTGTATLPTGTNTLAGLETKQTFAAQQTAFGSTKTYGATITWDGDTDGQIITVTATGSPTFAAPQNIVANALYILRFVQDGTGSRVPSWNAAFQFGTAGAPTLTTTATKTDVLSFIGASTTTMTYIGSRLDAV